MGLVTNDLRRSSSARAAYHPRPDWRSQRSQALVEFAVVAPLFLLVIFSAIDISRLLYAYTSISSAARDGARTASLASPTFSDCQLIQQVELVGQGFTLKMDRSEEHTSELQSHLNLVCRLLLEKKKIEVINRRESSVS